MCKHSFQYVKLHTSNYMYSGTQRMIELVSFTIIRLQLCTIEKVIYKTKLNEYIYFVGLDNPYQLKNWFFYQPDPSADINKRICCRHVMLPKQTLSLTQCSSQRGTKQN